MTAPIHMKTAYANQHHGPYPNGKGADSKAVALPCLIWRGVVERPLSDSRQHKTSSRFIPGIGLVPPALYEAKSPAEVNRAEKAHWKQYGLDARVKAIEHSYNSTSAPVDEQFYTSWSRSWVIALHWALTESLAAKYTGEGLEHVLKTTHLVAAFTHCLPDRVHDIVAELQMPFWRAAFLQTPTPSAAMQATATSAIERCKIKFSGVQEVTVFGAVPEPAFMAVPLWDLLKSAFGSNLHGVLDLPVGTFEILRPTLHLGPNNMLEPDFKLDLWQAMCERSEASFHRAGIVWTNLSTHGRFKLERTNKLRNSQLESEDAEIQERITHSLLCFRANEIFRPRAALLLKGEICWAKDQGDI